VKHLIASAKPLIPVLTAAAVGAAVLLRPVGPPPPVAASGWATGADSPPGARPHRTAAPQAMVYVAGEVARPGVYAVRPDARAKDALALAGGTRPEADLVAVNLAAHLRDGDEIVVPVRGARPAAPARTRGAASHGSGRRAHRPRRSRRHGHARADEPPPAGQVDVNAADADTLATIPGIGPGLAERIVAFRETNGAFASVDELLDVSGITDRRLDAMLPYVTAR
jgi:competence protein ComEA